MSKPETQEEPTPRFVMEMYYGKLVITHFDKDSIERIGKAVQSLLTTSPLGGSLATRWILSEDGKEYVDAVLDKTTGKWRKPTSADDHG